ncbi:MAG: methyltransferase domain-containing protein [Planctomycetes bacterium]|nr:methyltransferase domain-containing protein [Planctomycetota bacterium]
MASKSKVPTRDIGLEIGLVLARYLLNTEELHYGYWDTGVEVSLRNLPAAQRRHMEFLLSHVPTDAATVLDVGCGTGALAHELVQRGHQVECVAPDSTLLDVAEARLQGRAKFYRERFEVFAPGRQYDLIVFSESFQYPPLEPSMANIMRLLKPGGRLLICDFFKAPGKPGSPIGGGHKLNKFLAACSAAGLTCLTDIDITPFTAPNMTLVEEFFRQVGEPVWRILMDYAQANYPRRTGMAKWWFRKRLDKLERKYFSGQRNARTFSEFKTYRLFLMQKAPVGAAAQAPALAAAGK